MKDEEFVYKSDVRDKAVTARSAHHTRTHCGKGGRVRLPSDNLSKKELQKMNGEVKSYRLNSPMDWAEFKSMPDDLKVIYIKALRNKYRVPDAHIGNMMGVHKCSFIKEMARLDLSKGEHCGGRKKWDKDGFYAWANGVDVLPTPVIEDEPAEAPIIEEVTISQEEKEAIFFGEEKGYVEDDLPFEEPDPFQGELPVALHAEIDALKLRIDELLKINEELVAVREKDKAHIKWLEVRVDELGQERLMLEKQMDVVRLIFGGKNNG